MTRYILTDEQVEIIAKCMDCSHQDLEDLLNAITKPESSPEKTKTQAKPKTKSVHCAAILETTFKETKDKNGKWTSPPSEHRQCSQWAMKGGKFCHSHSALASEDVLVQIKDDKPATKTVRCNATTKSGKRCRMMQSVPMEQKNSVKVYCHHHDR
tara:strand:- start:130 stop:594 length:465 start_codon:yes stop_codon:yes gene_type:complete